MTRSSECVVCGLPLSGTLASLLAVAGIGRSTRNPNLCSRCYTHVEEGRLVEVTMLFVDLSGFTELTNRMGADPTYRVVDAYLRKAADVLAAHGAYIDKFIGDSVMAMFNVPVKRADHAAAAVAAAQMLQKELPALSGQVGQELSATVGIATGHARVGRLGSDDVKDFTALGAVVNEAARLQAQARAGEILVSERVYAQVAAAYPDVPAESLRLKGFSDPVVGRRLNASSGPPPEAVAPPALSGPRLSAGALLMAILGGSCLGISSFLALGATSGSLLLVAARWFDRSALRMPLLAAATLAAGATFYKAVKEARERAALSAKTGCIIDTPSEKRRNLLAASVSLLALVFVGIELFIHYVNHARFK